MDDGQGGDFSVIYQGKGYQNVLTATVSNLMTGYPYRFYLVAENDVGLSLPSSYTTIYACVAPSGLDRP